MEQKKQGSCGQGVQEEGGGAGEAAGYEDAHGYADVNVAAAAKRSDDGSGGVR